MGGKKVIVTHNTHHPFTHEMTPDEAQRTTTPSEEEEEKGGQWKSVKELPIGGLYF